MDDHDAGTLRTLRMICSAVVGCVFALFGSAAALAIDVMKPADPTDGSKITAVTDNGDEVAWLQNSGHFAQAAGTNSPYIWSCSAPAAVSFDFSVHPMNHTIRFMFNEGWAVSNNYASVVITVVDTGDWSVDQFEVWPITIEWVDNAATSSGKGRDRVVHNSRGDATRRRLLRFVVKGKQPVKTLRLIAYPLNCVAQYGTCDTDGVTLQAGQGRIQVHEYDGNASGAISPAGCTPMGSASPPFGVWDVTVSGGVTASWNPTNGDFGTQHTFTIEGTQTSQHKDDIELDLAIKQLPDQLGCPDGVGCVMGYTVCEIDARLENATTRAAQVMPGALLWNVDGWQWDTPDGRRGPGHKVDIPTVLPHDISRPCCPFTGAGDSGVFKMRLDVTDDLSHPRMRVELKTPNTPALQVLQLVGPSSHLLAVQTDLPAKVYLSGERESATLRDGEFSVRLVDHEDLEIGGGTCVERILTTVARVGIDGSALDEDAATWVPWARIAPLTTTFGGTGTGANAYYADISADDIQLIGDVKPTVVGAVAASWTTSGPLGLSLPGGSLPSSHLRKDLAAVPGVEKIRFGAQVAGFITWDGTPISPLAQLWMDHGVRTDDVAIFAWINGPAVPVIATPAVAAPVVGQFPAAGPPALPAASVTSYSKATALTYLGYLAGRNALAPAGPPLDPQAWLWAPVYTGVLTAADENYILHWVFSAGSCPPQPTAFASPGGVTTRSSVPTTSSCTIGCRFATRWTLQRWSRVELEQCTEPPRSDSVAGRSSGVPSIRSHRRPSLVSPGPWMLSAWTTDQRRRGARRCRTRRRGRSSTARRHCWQPAPTTNTCGCAVYTGTTSGASCPSESLPGRTHRSLLRHSRRMRCTVTEPSP